MTELQYDYRTIRGFIWSAIFWGVVGIVIGLLISAQMIWADLNFAPYLTFGRLRTVHTNGLAFGLGLGAVFGIFYYIVIKLAKRPLVLPKLARFHLWAFNAAIALAAVTLLLGYSQSLEYAELEWPLDIGVVILWVIFAINIIGTILKRNEEQMYISLWYIIATIVTIAILYIVNNLSIPTGLFKSYHLFAGLNSANVEWWYGHNAVGFLFTTPILAMFYYFLPKSTGIPIYSHRLSIIAFWSLIFIYLWTGAHHLVYSPVPDWLQTLAIVFSMVLIVPSWGSVVNGYYTVGSDWSSMKNNYLTKFFLLGITFYGLQTVQGPTQSLRVLSQIIHATDYLPGHVHMGTMGWVTLTACASIYYIIPKSLKTEIYSIKLANMHFWLVTISQLIFSGALWIAGIQQGLMWKATNADGSLMYSFTETVLANYPYYHIRLYSGVFYTVGMLIFIYNIYMTTQQGIKAQAEA